MRIFAFVFLASLLFSLSPVKAEENAVETSTGLPLNIDGEPVQLIQPEIDTAVLENLPKPTPTPPEVRLPRQIIEKGQWRGSLSGITRPATLVFRKTDTWQKFWALAMTPYSPTLKDVPPIDFSKDMVIGVFRGEEPYPNYQIEIHSIKAEEQNGERVLVVRYHPSEAMMGVFIPPFQVQPYHLLRVPVFAGRVVFLAVKH